MVDRTPLLPLSRIGEGLFGKVEFSHPSGSMKHRSIPCFLESSLARGRVAKGQRVIIQSGGSAAVAAAWAGARLQLGIDAVVSSSTGEEILRLLRWLGARCHAVRSTETPRYVEALKAEGAFFLDQFREEGLIDHYRPVAEEILDAVAGVDAVVVGIGTGVSITGIGRAIKHRAPACLVVGVEPEEASVAAGKPWAPHRIIGLAPPFAQPLLDRAVVDAIVPISSEAAWARARELAQREGLLAGPSSGAAVEAAVQLRRDRRASRIVAILGGGVVEHLAKSPSHQ
ncbi:pyridoxal-phosphate dependent enzyme [Piscinibacter sp. XHJ-5]|uniref:pyridoxal-phosphate dependent enzyme n=1 Tax=Piscinibacter sp. XHJ-5 TaxID=3037797 RepID=UPI002453664D|nr:pyridoxal-phosphate dependent enzyme [Piscinibacter sp. XHJ-5]